LDIPLSFDMKAMALMPKQNYSRWQEDFELSMTLVFLLIDYLVFH
jgi:hypothetical protein